MEQFRVRHHLDVASIAEDPMALAALRVMIRWLISHGYLNITLDKGQEHNAVDELMNMLRAETVILVNYGNMDDPVAWVLEPGPKADELVPVAWRIEVNPN